MQTARIYTLPVREREQLTTNDTGSLQNNEIICYSKQSLVPKQLGDLFRGNLVSVRITFSHNSFAWLV